MANRLREFVANRVNAVKEATRQRLRYRHLAGASTFGIRHVVEQLEKAEPLLKQKSSNLIRNGRSTTITVENQKRQLHTLTGLEAEQYRYKRLLEIKKAKEVERPALNTTIDLIKPLLNALIKNYFPDFNLYDSTKREIIYRIHTAIKKSSSSIYSDRNVEVIFKYKNGILTMTPIVKGVAQNLIRVTVTTNDIVAIRKYIDNFFTPLYSQVEQYKKDRFYDKEFEVAETTN